MYRVVYTKRAVKDIKNLKSAKLDNKARELIEIVKNNPFQNPHSMKNWLEICMELIQEELIYSIASFMK